jgi:hypothetical protein
MAKKLHGLVPWLTYLLNESLPRTRLRARDEGALKNRPVKIVDGTHATQMGAKGKVIRVHMCYDLTQGQMEEVHVTDNHTAESFTLFTINPGSIYMGDAGFGKGKNLEYIVSCEGDALLRVTPSQIALSEGPRGKGRIDMAKKLDTRENALDFTCYVHTEKRNYVPARIIASRLPEDKAADAVRRKKSNASKKQRVLKEETLIYAEWVIIMTSLGEEFSAWDILELYRHRWQVELLFKRIKQFFNVTRLKAATLQHSVVLVLLLLIIWALTERETIAAEMYLFAKQADMSRYSRWTMSGFFFHELKATINGLLALCFESVRDLLDVYRRLRNHKSSRHNQFSAFQFGCAC